MQNDMAQNDSVCLLCGEQFKSAIAMKNHILKTEEPKHQLLSFVYKELKIKCKEINLYVDKYRDFFDKVTEDTLSMSKEALLNKIKTDIQLEKEKKLEEKNKEKEQRKLQRHMQDIQRLAELEEKRNIEKRLEKDLFNSMPLEDRPKSIVEEFYTMIHSRCYNYAIEVKLIKSLYTKQKLTSKQVHFVIEYMAKMGCQNLRSINFKLNEALDFKANMDLIKQEGTVPHLVKYFYKQSHMRMNVKTFMKEVNIIKSSMLANHLSIEQVKNVIDGMIKNKVTVLLWFDNYVSRFSNIEQTVDPIHTCTNTREIKMNVKEVVNGNMTVDKISKRIKKDCIKKIYEIFKEGKFNDKYNYLEWAYKINLPLNKEMVDYANEHNKERCSRFDIWGQKVVSSNSDVLKKKYENVINLYKDWLSKLPNA